MNSLILTPLTDEMVSAAVALDQLGLGGFWTADGYRRELDSPYSDLVALRLADDARLDEPHPEPDIKGLIGLACLWAIVDEAHITSLVVHPHYQRQGLGQMLLLTLLMLAWKRGLQWATLEVRTSNEGAIALYHKLGFERVGQRRQYYPDGEDALILWLKGIQTPEFKSTLDAWMRSTRHRLAEQSLFSIRDEGFDA